MDEGADRPGLERIRQAIAIGNGGGHVVSVGLVDDGVVVGDGTDQRMAVRPGSARSARRRGGEERERAGGVRVTAVADVAELRFEADAVEEGAVRIDQADLFTAAFES